MGKVSDATLYELFYDAGKPDLKDTKVFGCAALVHIEQRYMPKDPSLPHRKPAIFVGMCEKSPSWRFLIPSTNKVISSDSAEFFEDQPGIQVGTTELAPVVPNDAILPCPSIEAVALAPVVGQLLATFPTLLLGFGCPHSKM